MKKIGLIAGLGPEATIEYHNHPCGRNHSLLSAALKNNVIQRI
jgi:aspartate/glutamate racemase